mgnify:CR=1 FL=1
MGGPSAEREVSLSSGRACAAALRDQGYQVIEVDADRDHLYRVLNNLARNAAQAIESQRASLTKQHGQPPPRSQTTISARREGLCTIIELNDDGPGVPPD